MPGLLELKAGDIFTWDNYPFFEHEEKIKRWFLFLGYQSIEAMVFQITATTKLHYYNQGNKRANHNFFKLPANAGGLEQDSIIDLTLYFEKRQCKDFTDYQSDIQKQGTLKQDQINSLVRCIKNDKKIPRIVKRDIFGYLREAGFKVA
jgi:hypothetical protein